nr:MAG TPA: hypothetical protein [Caudoviricetes sp.]
MRIGSTKFILFPFLKTKERTLQHALLTVLLVY